LPQLPIVEISWTKIINFGLESLYGPVY